MDEQDRALAEERPEELAAAGLPPDRAASVAAAIRELFEEIGILLARDETGRPLWMPEGWAVHREALAGARRAIVNHEFSLAEVLRRHGWRLAGDRLAYMGRWVTPPAAQRRFDTLFFMADMTGAVEPEPRPEDGEVALGEWIAPNDALAEEKAGRVRLMRPTRAWLEQLASCGSAAEAWSRFSRPGARREEVFETDTPEILRSVLEAQGVWMVPVPSPTLPPASDTNVYLVANSGEAVFVDAGHGGPEGIAMLRAAWVRARSPRVRAVILTHGHTDHAGSAAELAAAFQCPIWSHPSGYALLGNGIIGRHGRPEIERRALADGETIDVGRLQLQVFYTPGHAPDHLCLFIPSAGILFSGDNVVGVGSTWVGPPDGDMAVYLQSLERMAALPARVLAPGHGPLSAEPSRRIRELIEHRLAREAQIMEILQQGPHTVAALAGEIYGPAAPPGVMEVARRTVLGHLIKLEREGRVRRLAGGADLFAPADR